MVVGVEAGVGKPGEVVDAVLFVRKRFCVRGGDVRVRFLEARGVLQLAGGGDDEIVRDGDADVEAAEFAIEFTLVEIGDRVPAMAVVDRGFGIPLGYLIGNDWWRRGFDGRLAKGVVGSFGREGPAQIGRASCRERV